MCFEHLALVHEVVGLNPTLQETRSCNILSFLLPLFQEGLLSVTGGSMCTKYWLPLRRSKPAQEKCG